MRGKWAAALLMTTVMAGASHGAVAAERSSLDDLWSWRGAPAVSEPAPAAAPKPVVLADRVLSGRSSDVPLLAVATAPDAPAKPTPDRQTSQMLSTPMLPMPDDELPDNVKTAWGCIIGGTVGTGVALAANAENLINVIAGGIVAPASPAVLAIGLAGVVFGTFCTIGQAFTPLYVHYFGTPNGEGQPPKEVAMNTARPPASRTPDVVVNLSRR